ncbi:urease subunit beta [Agromyces aerolatus]|uniref:urease subunit beta n=1 Tax=Agromyces sp. LY-1074 TaxID=3074080 RepID=UPI0028650B14|nr:MULTISPECIES: urease subunit beta [unclassified Agromyces]MDR5700885.1 urease subunit beta [Agromyces sp. LY-1074]MDR5707454.1 urease subunit beta [Agromyces sp. LY-1358]
MNLTPTEIDRLILFSAAEFARRNRSLGIRLSHPEAVALLTDEAMTMARQGLTYDEIRDRAHALLTDDDVLSGVRSMVTKVLIELPMAEGTKLLALFDPILPTAEDDGMRPGEVIPHAPDVEVVGEEPAVELEVTNLGDRDIQVRSHTHFFEVNRALSFDRSAAFGRRLALPAGSGVRFEPGVPKRVSLIEIRGTRDVRGFADLTNGSVDDPAVAREAMARAEARGYLRTEQTNDFD